MFRLLSLLTMIWSIYCTDGRAQSIGGFPGVSPPAQATNPTSPTTDDVIDFSLVADGQTYSNDCYQTLFGFEADRLEINVIDETRTISIDAVGEPDGGCLNVSFPVTGLQGSVGPLVAGDWTIQSLFGETLEFTVSAFVTGDFNHDTKVDHLDLQQWKTSFGVGAAGDGDNDLDTDGADLLIWQRSLEAGGGVLQSLATAVPEPASLPVVLFATLLALARRKSFLSS